MITSSYFKKCRNYPRLGTYLGYGASSIFLYSIGHMLVIVSAAFTSQVIYWYPISAYTIFWVVITIRWFSWQNYKNVSLVSGSISRLFYNLFTFPYFCFCLFMTTTFDGIMAITIFFRFRNIYNYLVNTLRVDSTFCVKQRPSEYTLNSITRIYWYVTRLPCL